MCKEIILSLRKFYISLVPVWKSRSEKIIQFADMGSKDFPKNDFSLDPISLSLVKNVFGNFSFDAFASAPTAICDKLYSQFSTCGSSGVNFFHHTLSVEEHYFIFPPLYLAINTIKHLALYKAKGVIIVPIWPTSSWLNFFSPDGNIVLFGLTKCYFFH